MTTFRRSPLRLVAPLIVAALWLPFNASAQEPHMPTALELMSMPEYCQAKMGGNQSLHDAWRLRMGPNLFVHLHHFCHGLKHMRRAGVAVDSQKRRYQYERAIGEFDYVLRNWPPEFELYGQAQKQQKMARALLGRP